MEIFNIILFVVALVLQIVGFIATIKQEYAEAACWYSMGCFALLLRMVELSK